MLTEPRRYSTLPRLALHARVRRSSHDLHFASRYVRQSYLVPHTWVQCSCIVSRQSTIVIHSVPLYRFLTIWLLIALSGHTALRAWVTPRQTRLLELSRGDLNRFKGLMVHRTHWVGDLQIIVLLLLCDHYATSRRLSGYFLFIYVQVHWRPIALLLDRFVVDVDIVVVVRMVVGSWLWNHLSWHLLVKVNLFDLLVRGAFQAAWHLLAGMW